MTYNYAARKLPYKLHKERIIHELIEAGVTTYGLMKSESRYLPRIINEIEHIKAVVYGLHGSSLAMLIATDKRLIYLDKKPIVEMLDEISYEVVSGIEMDLFMFFATVTLHTAVGNYKFQYVNPRCAEKFVQHIEEQRMKHSDSEELKTINISKEIENFLPNYLHWVHEEDKKVKQ
jgi:hypothetical protein